jgi:rubrerythrin
MPDLNGTKTHENLRDAFAGESQANRRYLTVPADARLRRLPRDARER